MSGPLRSFGAALLIFSIPTLAAAQEGFAIHTADGENRLQFNFLLQVEGRFAVDDPQHNVADTYALRRLRPILQGHLAKFFDFYVNPDFAGGVVNIRDAYLDTRFSPAFRIRVGKGKEPFGLERLHSASHLTFVERALPSAVAPDRDIGILALGDVMGGVVSYAGGVVNGVADGASADLDTHDGKDAVGRVVVTPLARSPGHPIAGLGLAFAASTGTQNAALPAFRTSGQQVFFSYDHAAIGEGVRNRVSPQAFYYYKAVGAFGEYVRSRGIVRKDVLAREITHESWQVAGSLVVTGEPASDHGVKPASDFNPGNRTWGALQIAARYHVLSIDPAAIASGFAAAGSSREARAFTVGANWYLNPLVKWTFNVERTVFDGGPNGSRYAENAILVLNQISF